MTKSEIIQTLNDTDDYRALGFERLADDKRNTLIAKKWGRGAILLNRWENEDGNFGYDEDVTGWES